MSKPIAVVISDVHYSLKTLDIADKAFRAAIDKAAELGLPLIDAGDLTNDKAIIRGEVMNRLIDTFKYANSKGIRPVVLVGNHSLINEKGSENALAFLAPYAHIIDEPLWTTIGINYITYIPYQTSTERFREIVNSTKTHKLVICHQGFLGAFMGDYIQDKTSIDPTTLGNKRIISGHYHRHQSLGNVTYVGNPYTLTFGEANDGPKGFIILNEDGTFTREILPYRQHVKIECQSNETYWLNDKYFINQNDLVWVKVHGSRSDLDKVDKDKLGNMLLGHSNYKLDLIVTESEDIKQEVVKNMSHSELLDAIIDLSPESDSHKASLKDLWRSLV